MEGPKERARHENDDPDWDLIEEVLNENVTLTEVVTTSMFSTLDFETTANLAAEAGKYKVSFAFSNFRTDFCLSLFFVVFLLGLQFSFLSYAWGTMCRVALLQ